MGVKAKKYICVSKKGAVKAKVNIFTCRFEFEPVHDYHGMNGHKLKKI